MEYVKKYGLYVFLLFLVVWYLPTRKTTTEPATATPAVIKNNPFKPGVTPATGTTGNSYGNTVLTPADTRGNVAPPPSAFKPTAPIPEDKTTSIHYPTVHPRIIYNSTEP